MSDIAIVGKATSLLIGSCSNGESPLGLSVPFPTTITLHEDILVAGTSHVDDIDAIIEGAALPFEVKLVRDPGNLHDTWAIKVMKGSKRIGFVPCDSNEVIARLMDGGKRIEGSVFEKEKLGRWTKLHMEVRLVD